MAILKEKAQVQGLHFRPAPVGEHLQHRYPALPGKLELQNTVMFVEFAGGTDDNPDLWRERTRDLQCTFERRRQPSKGNHSSHERRP